MPRMAWIGGLLASLPAMANANVDATISGDRTFGQIGNRATITLNEATCTVQALGQQRAGVYVPEAFQIVLTCGERTQVLWDIANLHQDSYAFDEPGFAIEWAGDRDGDGKLDLVMDMSPKYSCWKVITYLSSSAGPDDIVRATGTPDEDCGC